MKNERDPKRPTTHEEATDAALQRLVDLALVDVSDELGVDQFFRISDRFTSPPSARA